MQWSMQVISFSHVVEQHSSGQVSGTAFCLSFPICSHEVLPGRWHLINILFICCGFCLSHPQNKKHMSKPWKRTFSKTFCWVPDPPAKMFCCFPLRCPPLCPSPAGRVMLGSTGRVQITVSTEAPRGWYRACRGGFSTMVSLSAQLLPLTSERC